MAYEIGYLTGGEGADSSIRLPDPVDQIGGEGLAEGVEAPLFQSCRVQDTVVFSLCIPTSLSQQHTIPQEKEKAKACSHSYQKSNNLASGVGGLIFVCVSTG